MPTKAAIVEKAKRANQVSIDETIAQDSTLLSSQLQVLFERLFSPDARKSLRRFSSTEAAKLLGVTDSYVRHLAAQVENIAPEKTATGRRALDRKSVV